MELATPVTATALADTTGGRLIGDGELIVTGLNEIHHVRAGDVCFVDHPRYYAPTLASAATVILIDKRVDPPPGKALIVLDSPFEAYNQLVLQERPASRWANQHVSPSATIGKQTRIAPGAVVGHQVAIGEGCYLGPNAVLTDGVRLGNNVYIGAGAVLGEEAFYFKRTAEGMLGWRSGGTVIVEDDVFIGANCNVSRGVSSPTVIGRGSKLDALVQIGHDCKIGRHCLLAAQVGVAGNTTLGDWCILQGQAGVTQNLRLAERTTLMAQSGLMDNTQVGKAYFGSPAQESRLAFRDLLEVRRLRER